MGTSVDHFDNFESSVISLVEECLIKIPDWIPDQGILSLSEKKKIQI